MTARRGNGDGGDGSAPGRSFALRRFLEPGATPPTAAERTPALMLRRFLEPKVKAAPGEACEFCTEPIGAEHPHVVNVQSRALMCACRGCYLLFSNEGAAGGKYRAVPDRATFDPDFALTEAQWDALQIPVGICFLFHNSSLGRPAAFYPSPAGATESLLSLEVWDEIVHAHPRLQELVADVQALLVRRRTARESSRPPGPDAGASAGAGAGAGAVSGVGQGADAGPTAATECYVVPIDRCYELVGLIRRYWKGFDGGEEAHAAIEHFFDELRRTSDRPRRVASA